MTVNTRVEKSARTFVDAVVKDYGAKSALARAQRLTHEYRKRPQWLTRAIEILQEMNR